MTTTARESRHHSTNNARRDSRTGTRGLSSACDRAYGRSAANRTRATTDAIAIVARDVVAHGIPSTQRCPRDGTLSASLAR